VLKQFVNLATVEQEEKAKKQTEKLKVQSIANKRIIFACNETQLQLNRLHSKNIMHFGSCEIVEATSECL